MTHPVLYLSTLLVNMKKEYIISLSIVFVLFVLVSFNKTINPADEYANYYKKQCHQFERSQRRLLYLVESSTLDTESSILKIREQLQATRLAMKEVDFWFRYLDPIAYKKINGPLPVEWETEVFEKFEKPYRRDGAGYTLALLYLDEPELHRDTLLGLIKPALSSTLTYTSDSIVKKLESFDHFFFCNRLFLLNLAAIYTTGFDCPDSAWVVPELRSMLSSARMIYASYNHTFTNTPLPESYLNLYEEAVRFVENQPDEYSAFDHYTFVQKYINPLFSYNQKYIHQYKAHSSNVINYSLSKHATSIFSKELYRGQNTKGVYIRVQDQEGLALLDKVGKLLFYDPILSGNNQRSCVSCHKPTQYFTDTLVATSLQFNGKDVLRRNSPSLINAEFNHLLMLDGNHISLQDQARSVMTDSLELGGSEQEILKKVLSCKEYKEAFTKLLVYTPQEKEITFEHITSALTFYYTKFSMYYSPFDESMNNKNVLLDARVKNGFNLFMSKAQCATCHFVPQFNGVKPPFVNSEFEVLGVPSDARFTALDQDEGRYEVNPEKEMKHAFRTGSIRNAQYTKPYMHNGIFNSLEEVIDFYDAGGGQGRGLKVDNQTLSSDSLHLSVQEKANLVLFMQSLNENIVFEYPPSALPLSKYKDISTRRVGGNY